jgi:hypothetical protein
MATAIKQRIMQQLDRMAKDEQQQVLDFVSALVENKPEGVPGETLLVFAGAIDKDDLGRMEQAIEEECEQVDPNEW